MKLSRFDYKKVLLLILTIAAVCVLKLHYINSLPYDSFADLVCNSLVFWGDNQFVNLIWCLPILINLLYISKKYYEQLVVFNMRYKNRNFFILHTIKNCFVYSVFCNLIIVLVHIVFILYTTQNNILFSLDLVKFIVTYVLMNSFLSYILIYFALISRHYIYSLLTTIIVCIFSFILFYNNEYLLFPRLFYSNEIILALIILLFGIVCLIRKKYLKLDIGGLENDFRN